MPKKSVRDEDLQAVRREDFLTLSETTERPTNDRFAGSNSQERPAPEAYISPQIAPQMTRLFEIICFHLVLGRLTKLGNLGSLGNHAPHDNGTERAVWALLGLRAPKAL